MGLRALAPLSRLWARRPAASDSRLFAPSRFDGLPPARRSWPWWAGGLVLGGVLVLLVQAPASWLAAAVADATGQRVLLADARGSVWSGSAVLVLSGGPGSRDASALPGRLRWTLGLSREQRTRPELRLRHACCIGDQLRLQIEPGIRRLRVFLLPGRAEVGHWPAAWLAGLGAPFNTVRLGGSLRLIGDGFSVETVDGRWRVDGRAELEVLDLSSALAPVDALGSYRLALSGGAAATGGGAQLQLATERGPLRMTGSGQWVGSKLRFRGEAQADAGSEPLLNNLLNLLGQRRGAVTLLAIG
jgi:general secretion pathway protein N